MTYFAMGKWICCADKRDYEDKTGGKIAPIHQETQSEEAET